MTRDGRPIDAHALRRTKDDRPIHAYAPGVTNDDRPIHGADALQTHTGNKTFAVGLPSAAVEGARRALLARGLLDTRLKPRVEDGMALLPVVDADEAAAVAGAFGGRIVEVEGLLVADSRPSPFDTLFEELGGVLTPEQLSVIPDRWEIYGRVAVVKLHPRLLPLSRIVGAALADSIGVETVLDDLGPIAGGMREPSVRVIHGDSAETRHREHGVVYEFDASRLMFASGNKEERRRMGELDCRGETVADMFAGIGYFAVPIAKFGRARRVIAAEVNPVSHHYLVRNVSLNGVAGAVEPMLGDNRTVLPDGIADRVLMGYVGDTHEYLDKAMRLLRPEGGTIHYHESCPEPIIDERPVVRVASAAENAGRGLLDATVRRVKSYAPGVWHVVVDAEIGDDTGLRFERTPPQIAEAGRSPGKAEIPRVSEFP